MDHTRLLTILHRLGSACGDAEIKRSQTSEWNWGCTPVVFPESHCPFCLNVIRSRGIWFLDEEKKRLIGAWFPHFQAPTNRQFVLTQPRHPHDTGGGYLCTGHNPSAVALLASTPNVTDSPLGRINIPKWLQTYWDHDCPQMRSFLEALIPVSMNARARLRELGPAPVSPVVAPVGPIATGPKAGVVVTAPDDETEEGEEPVIL